MGIYVEDAPGEIKFQVNGRLSGASVLELGRRWSECLTTGFWQKVVVDLSPASECDIAGEHLLARMLQHGAHFSARTPASLDLLRRVSDRASWIERKATPKARATQAGAA